MRNQLKISKDKISKVNNSNSKNRSKTRAKPTAEHFNISNKEKQQLGELAVRLKKIDPKFNLHTFLLRRKKLKGFFPPPDKVIKIGNFVLQGQKRNLWAYFTVAISKEEAMSFAEKNIKEGQDFKNAQPIAVLLNPELLASQGNNIKLRRSLTGT